MDPLKAGDEFDRFLEQADYGTWIAIGVIAFSILYIFIRVVF